MMGRTATLTVHQNGTVTVRGLTPGDLRLIANAVEQGAFQGGDRGGPVSDALYRLSHLLRYPSMYGAGIGSAEFTVARSDPTELFHDIHNL